ncbi:MAG TPA: ABC transporter substrate-binding protein [Acidobacteriaceae bacterium]|nr:ABC transporter substrate-binding protein [Acidobacteriaceae bacterium]
MAVRFPAIAAALLLAALAVRLAWADGAPRMLVIAANAEPDTLDLAMTREGPSAYPILENMTERLVGEETDGKFVPTLATWELAADGKELVFHLKPGIKFSSGDPLTARDIVFAYERAKAKAPMFLRHARFVDSITAVDDHTVKLRFKQPDVGFIAWRGLLAESMAYYNRVGEKEFVAHPVGTGPYKIVDYKPGDHLDMARFDGYWGRKPAVDKARFVFIKDDTTRIAKLKAGEVDLIMNTPYADVDALHAAGFHTRTLAAFPSVSIQFQIANKKAPWADVRVRRAIAEAIDADAIIKGLFHGVPDRYPRLAPGELGYDPTLRNYRYDPADARKLLAEAGYPHGFKMPFYTWAGTYYGIPETAEAAVLYLKAVGIDAEMIPLDAPKYMDKVRSVARRPDAEFVGLATLPMANLSDPTDALSVYYSSSAFSIYRDAALDTAIGRALGELDPAKRADDIKAAFRLMQDQVATIVVWDSVSVYTMKRDLDYTPLPRMFPLLLLQNVALK